MKRPFLAAVLLLLGLPLGRTESSELESRLSPDTIFMNDGRVLHGLIVRNDAKVVTLQQRKGEVEIPKAYIRRIDDEPDSGVYFASIVDPNKLPPWRMIVQDLRSDDSIKFFRQIPATTVESGYFKNIPYLSFRINKRVEMNVYGNPEDPVGIEFGIYERGEKITNFKKIIRAYLAGVLQSREEIKALYKLDEKGGKTKVGRFIFEITPPTAPDSNGGWWLSIYEPGRLDQARVSDAEYKKITLPFNVVNNSSGELRRDRINSFDHFLSKTKDAWSGIIPDLRGFYRDSMGQLALITPEALKKKPHAPAAQ